METCSPLHISGLLAHQWLSHKQSHFVYVFEKADVKWPPYEEAIIIRCAHHCLLMKKMPFIYFHTFKVHAWAEPVFLNSKSEMTLCLYVKICLVILVFHSSASRMITKLSTELKSANWSLIISPLLAFYLSLCSWLITWVFFCLLGDF